MSGLGFFALAPPYGAFFRRKFLGGVGEGGGGKLREMGFQK